MLVTQTILSRLHEWSSVESNFVSYEYCMRVVINHLCGHAFTVNVLSAAALEHEQQLIENPRCLLCEVGSERAAIERVENLFR